MFEFLKRKSGKSINVNDLDELIGTIEIIDIREPQEFKAGSLKTAKNIPMAKLLDKPDRFLKKDKTYYVMCQTGMRSKSATQMLLSAGYMVMHVKGGMGTYSGKNKVYK